MEAKNRLKGLALEVIEAVERLTDMKLPRDIMEIIPDDDEGIFIRFKKPEHFDSGEPIYYGVILFWDGDEDTITALEVLDYREVLEEAKKPNPEPFTGLIRVWPPETKEEET